MSDFQAEMNRVVSDFVAQITELARAAARDMLGEGDGNLDAGPLKGVRVPLPMLRDDYYTHMPVSSPRARHRSRKSFERACSVATSFGRACSSRSAAIAAAEFAGEMPTE